MPASRIVLAAAAVLLLGGCAAPSGEWDVDVDLTGPDEPAAEATGWIVDGGGVGPIRLGDTWAASGEHLTGYDMADESGCGSAWGTGPNGETVSLWGDPNWVIAVEAYDVDSEIAFDGYGPVFGSDASAFVAEFDAVIDPGMPDMMTFVYDGQEFTAFERDGKITTIIVGTSGFLGC